jgi:cyanosortase A-associated protein
MLSLAIAIGVPTAGQLQVEPLKFPASGVPLPDWEVVSTERLVSPTQKLSKGIEVVQAGQRYRYRSSDGQQLQVDIRYQLGEKSGSGNVGVRQADINPKAPPAQTIVGQTETGFYRLTTNERAIGLDACINPRGGSTVTAVQFVANRYQYDFKPHRLWNWFLGRDILKDDRCLWTSMSVPIDGIAPEAAKKDLVAAWLAWADWWQPRFPKP